MEARMEKGEMHPRDFLCGVAPAARKGLAAEAEALDELAVAGDVGAREVIEKAAALGDHDDEAAAGVVVLLVGLQVAGQIADALGKEGDLDFDGAGVGFVALVVLADGGFLGTVHMNDVFLVVAAARGGFMLFLLRAAEGSLFPLRAQVFCVEPRRR